VRRGHDVQVFAAVGLEIRGSGDRGDHPLRRPGGGGGERGCRAPPEESENRPQQDWCAGESSRHPRLRAACLFVVSVAPYSLRARLTLEAGLRFGFFEFAFCALSSFCARVGLWRFGLGGWPLDSRVVRVVFSGGPNVVASGPDSWGAVPAERHVSAHPAGGS